MSNGSPNFFGLDWRRRLAVLVCGIASALVSASGSPRAQDLALASCLNWIDKGAYPSGIEQERCEAKFDLPDPFSILCLSRIFQDNWPVSIDKVSCRIHLTQVITRQFADYPKWTNHFSPKN
jgi:hypothetical protein